MKTLVVAILFFSCPAFAADARSRRDAAKLWEQSRKDARFFSASEKLRDGIAGIKRTAEWLKQPQ